MPMSLSVPTGNQLLTCLAALQPHHSAALQATLAPVTIASGTVLAAAGAAPSALYFIDSGVVSVIGHTGSGESLELGCVGTEGLTTVGWLLGGAAPPYSFVAQLPLTARRLDVADAFRWIAEGGLLSELITKYGQYVISQLAQSALCARFHTAVARLARWLLLTRSRFGHNVLPLTHEALSHMVGATRSVVSDAIATLRQSACVGSSRGAIEIVDANRLRQHTCECFDVERERLRAFEQSLCLTNRSGRYAQGHASPSPDVDH
jgi:CRP-like cAMP-binding protein